MTDEVVHLAQSREEKSAFGDAFRRQALADRARQFLGWRRARASFLPNELIGEPVWDMLLDLFIASCESKRISVSSACIASGVPPTTALRHLVKMEQYGLVERSDDDTDGRRIYVAISPSARQAISDWLESAR